MRLLTIGNADYHLHPSPELVYLTYKFPNLPATLFYMSHKFLFFKLKNLPRILSTFFMTIFISGQAWLQETEGVRISGNFKHLPAYEFFNQIESNYPLKFYFQNEWFAKDTIDLSIDNRIIDDVLKKVLANKSLSYTVINNNHYIFLPKEKVAILAGELMNFSDNAVTDLSFIQVGKPDEAGKFKSAAITGHVTDGKTNEPIIGATIQVNNIQRGVVTNLQGNFSISLAPGLYTIEVSSIGYEKALYNVKILSNGELNFELFEKSIALEDIIIYGQRVDKNVSSHQMSLIELDIKSIKQLPIVSGGKDILKGLTSMPGIKSIGEFSSGINVRGGGEDQNLYLVNGAPLFNTSHVLGLFSVINPDAVERLSLYKGHIPAAYGERVSSVVDIHTLETPPVKARVKGGIGIYDSRLMFNLPIYKDRVYFDMGGRTSYSNWILKNAPDFNLSNSLASFYDINGTLHINLGKNHISISGYASNDIFRFASEVNYNYGNKLGSINWSYMFNSNLASYLTLAYSQYSIKKDDISSDLKQTRLTSGIEYESLKYKLKYTGIKGHNLDAGFSIIKYNIPAENISPLNPRSLIISSTIESKQAYEGAFFINDEYTVSEYLSFNAGFRISGYVLQGPASLAQYAPGVEKDTSTIISYKQYGTNAIIQTYYGFEPRLSSRLQLDEHSSVKISYNRNLQYLSMISYSSVATPADIWKLADPYIKPLIANQIAIGYFRNFLNNSVEVSVEMYYKSLKNVIEYKNGGNFEMNSNIEDVLLNASGRNYGLELLVKKNSGKIEGWLSYTYSRSLRKTVGLYPSEMINNNNYFPSSYDIPHDLTLVLNYHLNKRVQFSGNFAFASGRPITLPEYKYFVGNDVAVVFSDKNAYRIPSYNRLDLSITVDESLKLKKKWKGSWSFSILNVYGRKNPYTIFFKKADPNAANDYNPYSLFKLYLIGKPVPTLTYNFIF